MQLGEITFTALMNLATVVKDVPRVVPDPIELYKAKLDKAESNPTSGESQSTSNSESKPSETK